MVTFENFKDIAHRLGFTVKKNGGRKKTGDIMLEIMESTGDSIIPKIRVACRFKSGKVSYKVKRVLLTDDAGIVTETFNDADERSTTSPKVLERGLQKLLDDTREFRRHVRRLRIDTL